MDRRGLLKMFGLAALAGGKPAPLRSQTVTHTTDAQRAQFAGIYKLVVYAPYGSNPTGRIYYDRGGRMWAMLYPPGRKPLPQNATLEDYRAAQRGLIAYYGAYDVDEATGRVIHHIEAGSNPAWVGTDFIRWYQFSGNRLTLRTSATSNSPLVWERLPEP